MTEQEPQALVSLTPKEANTLLSLLKQFSPGIGVNIDNPGQSLREFEDFMVLLEKLKRIAASGQ